MTDPIRDEGQDVNAIRDILFGQQMRDYERRFGQLEQSMAEQLEALRSSLTGQREQQQTQAQALQDSLDALSGEMNQLRQELTTSITDQIDALQNASVSRADLAEWLRDLAGRIDGQ